MPVKTVKRFAKSWLQSTSVLGSLVAISASAFVLITPELASLLKRHVPQHAADITDIEEIIRKIGGLVGLGGAAQAIAGRVAVGDVYTPHGLPGPNIEDFLGPEPEPLAPLPEITAPPVEPKPTKRGRKTQAAPAPTPAPAVEPPTAVVVTPVKVPLVSFSIEDPTKFINRGRG